MRNSQHFGGSLKPLTHPLNTALEWPAELPGGHKVADAVNAGFPVSVKSGNVREFCFDWNVG